MINFFSTKKGKTGRSARRAAKQAEEEDAKPNWPSLSPAPSMNPMCLEEKTPVAEGAALLTSRSHEDLIPSFAPPAHLQASCCCFAVDCVHVLCMQHAAPEL